MFLTREQAEQLDLVQATAHLKLLNKTYNLDKPLHVLPTSVWPDLDRIANTLLYLEDQIKALEFSSTISQAQTDRWALAKAAE